MQELLLHERPKLAARLARWPRPLHRDGFPLVLMWSPKAGCTTLLKWFLFQIGELEQAMAYHRWVHKYRQDVLCAGDAYVARTAEVLAERRRPVIKLVRDPWQRAVSSYLHQAQSRITESQDWPGDLRAELRELNGEPRSREPISFRDYARGLSRRSVRQGSVNPHIAEQYSRGEEQFAIKLIRLEGFAEEIGRIERDFGLKPAPLDILSKSHHHHRKKQRLAASAADLPVDASSFPRRSAPPYEAFYDEETRDLIAATFRTDIERYGYGPA